MNNITYQNQSILAKRKYSWKPWIWGICKIHKGMHNQHVHYNSATHIDWHSSDLAHKDIRLPEDIFLDWSGLVIAAALLPTCRLHAQTLASPGRCILSRVIEEDRRLLWNWVPRNSDCIKARWKRWRRIPAGCKLGKNVECDRKCLTGTVPTGLEEQEATTDLEEQEPAACINLWHIIAWRTIGDTRIASIFEQNFLANLRRSVCQSVVYVSSFIFLLVIITLLSTFHIIRVLPYLP